MFLVFLLLAPLGPLVAVAGAFGGWTDPCHAVLRTRSDLDAAADARPYRRRRRACRWCSRRPPCRGSPIEAGWQSGGCCPRWRLAVVTLALSTWIDVERAAIVVGGVWVALPVALRLPVHDLLDAFAGPVQIVSAVAAAVGALVVVARQSKFDYRELMPEM